VVPAPVFSLSRRSDWRAIKNWFLSGRVAGFPAEFAYALAEIPTRRPPEESGRLHRLKGRPDTKPVLYLAGSRAIVSRFAILPSDPSRLRFLDRGPRFLTFLLPARRCAASLGMSRSGKVAFRIPEDPLLREFLVYLGEPLSGTSLNRSGEPPLRSLEEIRMVFPDLAVVDGGFRPGAPVSPILDLTLFDRPVPRRSWRSLPIR